MLALSLARASLLSLVLLPVACAPEVSTARMGGVYPPRGAGCEFELRSGTVTPELVQGYDTVGTVSVAGKDGEPPNAPRILALVKAEACALGGEVVLVAASMNLTNGINTASHHSFIVFRKKTGAPASQKF